jgi:hypothetical protein
LPQNKKVDFEPRKCAFFIKVSIPLVAPLRNDPPIQNCSLCRSSKASMKHAKKVSSEGVFKLLKKTFKMVKTCKAMLKGKLTHNSSMLAIMNKEVMSSPMRKKNKGTCGACGKLVALTKDLKIHKAHDCEGKGGVPAAIINSLEEHPKSPPKSPPMSPSKNKKIAKPKKVEEKMDSDESSDEDFESSDEEDSDDEDGETADEQE